MMALSLMYYSTLYDVHVLSMAQILISVQYHDKNFPPTRKEKDEMWALIHRDSDREILR